MSVLRPTYTIENIEETRFRQGIVDATLKTDIERLKAGDSVKLSLETGGHGYETISIRLTSNRDGLLRGRIVKQPKAANLRSLKVGSLMTFRAEHVHSVVGRSNSATSMDRSMPTVSKAELMRKARIEAELECETPSRPILHRARMQSRSAPRRVLVRSDGKDQFILVPIDKSRELHVFLRANHVRSNPPQPCYSDCDRIELGKGTEPQSVQKVLDLWSSRNATSVPAAPARRKLARQR